MKYDKKTLFGAGVAVLLLVIAFMFTFRHKKVEAPLPVVDNSIVPASVEQPKVKAPTKKVSVDYTLGFTYAQALAKYSGLNLLQFNDACQVHPRMLALANGSKLMLDNRSTHSEVIKIGDNSYTMDPYSFKIVTLQVEKVPTVYGIDCKNAENVGTLTIE
jgi:hypothetical protein